MNVLVWHVHGSWMTAFVQGPHRYLVPVVPDRGPDGLGRARTWQWPDSVIEVTPEQLADAAIDVVVVQRVRDLTLAREWTGRIPGDAAGPPVVWVEHDTPLRLDDPRHPAAAHPRCTVAHVTGFNAVMWDCGEARTVVIEHGIPDPGHRWSGHLPAGVAAINEPVRRWWVAGVDLLREAQQRVRIDLFGMGAAELGGCEVVQAQLFDEMARRRVYVHPFRWTSLGLSLVEAMHLGMPVVALAATEAPRVLPSWALAHDAVDLATMAGRYVNDLELASERGRRLRDIARSRFGLERFLADWDHLLDAVA